tara:strand:- start:28978 stop:31698 length:2721 start_codon:yes stop_codon:yes gene_type:complete
MPYRKVTFPPGINREGTQYSAEGNWFDCDLIRFRQGRPEKIGGWTKYSSNEFLGISRSLMNWSSIGGANLMAVGSDKKLYVELGGVYHDITPMDYKSQGTLTTAAGINDAVTTLQFDFAVVTGDIVRMGSDANAVGDELILIGADAAANVDTTSATRGYANTTASAHALGDAAFLLQKISNPIYLIQNSTTALIHYPAHQLISGDFINFLKIGTSLTGIGAINRDDLYYPAHASVPAINGYDTTRSTQSFPVTKVLTSDYFEIRISTAPTGLSNSALNGSISSSDTTITVDASSVAWAANDLVRIGSEYIKLGTANVAKTVFESCLRSQFGSMSSGHSDGASVSEVGAAASGQGGDTIIMRDIQASSSTFSEFSGWGSGTWGGIPTATTSTTLSTTLSSTATSASVASTESFSSTGTLLIESELITFTVAGGSTTFNPIVREQGGTTGAVHSSGTSAFLVDQYWTAWGAPTVPMADSTYALNVWSLDTFGEDLVAAKDRSRPYYWNTSLKMSNGYPYSTESDSSNDYASGIMLADAVPMSSLGLSTDDGHGDVPEEVGFLMTNPASRQVIAFGCSDTFGNFDPMLIRWCDEDHPGSWNMTDQNSAGGAPLQKGSKIIAAARSDRQTLIWTDNAMYSLQYIGGDFVFSLQEVADGISISSRNAHKAGRGIVYWMGDNNFYQSDGRTVQKVPCSILSKVFEELNYDKREVVFSAINSLFNEIIWFYPSGDETEPNKYALLNYVDNTWAYGSMARSSWSDSGLRENPNASYNKGPYDSGVYQGIDRSIIYNHEDGYTDDESKMNSYIESAFFDIEDGDLSMFADRFAPDFRSLGSTASPELTAVLTAKNYPSSSASKTRSLALTESTEFVNTRLRGRTMSIKFNDNEGPSNAGWELGDSRIRIKPDGRR